MEFHELREILRKEDPHTIADALIKEKSSDNLQTIANDLCSAGFTSDDEYSLDEIIQDYSVGEIESSLRERFDESELTKLADNLWADFGTNNNDDE